MRYILSEMNFLFWTDLARWMSYYVFSALYLFFFVLPRHFCILKKAVIHKITLYTCRREHIFYLREGTLHIWKLTSPIPAMLPKNQPRHWNWRFIVRTKLRKSVVFPIYFPIISYFPTRGWPSLPRATCVRSLYVQAEDSSITVLL